MNEPTQNPANTAPSGDGPTVLVIDDDQALRFAMRKALRRLSFEVLEAASGEEALPLLRSAEPPDAALLDLRMRGMDGLEVLRRRGPGRTRVIVLTGHGTVDAAVTAMKLGAFSFLEKPVDAEVLGPLLRSAVAESRRARAAGSDEGSLPPFVGHSAAVESIRRFIARVAPTDETVTVVGETGTGKEVVARHVHAGSARRAGPFVALNAACVPHELFESELFGHKKGAFTGASGDRKGLFREADGGTLFIDELGELPTESQAKLLRALEARTIRPLGESREIPVDVRIVAATNRDLWSEVRAGRFREDLYFRLQVFPVVLPPLRQRREDVPPLTEHLLARLGASALHLAPEALAALQRYDWPGNVRELLNVLRRASLFAEGHELGAALVQKMIAASIFGHGPSLAAVTSAPEARPFVERAPDTHRTESMSGVEPSASTRFESTEDPSSDGERKSLAEVEREYIERTLAEEGGNITKAAAVLGIDRRTLQRKLRGYEEG